MARGLNAHGVTVAVPTYDLCPQVSVDDIIGEMRAAMPRTGEASAGRSSISGHSAGGHLAACMLATDWPALRCVFAAELVTAAYAISGLFDLEPLVETSINKALGLDQAAARPQARCSGSRRPAAAWMRSSAAAKARNISGKAAALSRRGAAPALRPGSAPSPAANHFTAIAPLADPASPMVLRLKELAGR